MNRLRWSAFLFVVLSLLGGQAVADPSKDQKQARRSFERAEAHFNAGLFAEALAEYQEGYQHMPLPGFLVNIAQCQRRLGDLEQARATYRKFLLVAPDSPYVPEVRSLVAELDKLLDGAAASPPPAPSKERAAEPASPTMPGLEPKGTGEGAALAAQNLVTVPAEQPPPPPPSKRRWWLWGSIGGAVAAGTVTAILLLRSPETTTIHDGSIGTLRR